MIETKRLILREMTSKDLDELSRILTDPRTMKFWEKPFSINQVENWIERNIKAYKQYGYGRWLVCLKEENRVIGDVGFLVVDINDKVENDLGYIIHADYWNKGYGKEAAEACLNYGFTKLGMKRIIANMAWDHYSSIKLAKKIGMKEENEFINKRNRGILTYLYSIEKEV
ncbi:GNAT family N-acetyltransferase [Sporosalibacterium faouarense]|uniref:GNAT family N-acetyltransferase n=1 Tax=Sporosalibacterium faouarense TaxID=516123 RepID=UPI00192CE1BA|nr:GNAT family N-acetyltransferase [Sporosalibacterium faouarense]